MLQINWIDIKYLGGPISFAILTPTSVLPFKNKHPLILLGDHHGCRKNICDYKKIARKHKEKQIIVHTNTPVWFRLLDCYGTVEHPVQYFVESYFEKNLINDPFYQDESNSKWMTSSSFVSFMNYIVKFHPSCFQHDSKHCITTNIKYNFADLRLSVDYLHLTQEHENIIKANSFLQINNDKVHQDSTYMLKKLAKKIEQRKVSTDTDESNKIISKLPAIKSFPFYENQLSFYIDLYLTKDRFELDENKYDRLFHFNGRQIIQYSIDLEFNKLFHLIFNPNSKYLQEHSKLFQVCKQLDFEWCLNIFEKYFVYFMKNNNHTILKYKHLYQHAIHRYQIDSSEILQLNIKQLQRTIGRDHEYNYHQYFDVSKYLSDYKILSEYLSTIIMCSFNDMFMFFSSLLHSSPLSVYNAGNKHVVNLYKFLIQEKFYSGTILGHQETEIDDDDDHKHCIKFNDHIDIDNIVYPYVDTQKRELIIRRFDGLGSIDFLHVLRGNYLSHDQIMKNKNIQDMMEVYGLQDFQAVIEFLKFTSIESIVPEEYLSQTTQFNSNK